jgi:hypothetical protein
MVQAGPDAPTAPAAIGLIRAGGRDWSDVDGDLGAEKDEGPEQDREKRRYDDAEGLEVVQVVMAGGNDHADHHPHHEAQRYGMSGAEDAYGTVYVFHCSATQCVHVQAIAVKSQPFGYGNGFGGSVSLSSAGTTAVTGTGYASDPINAAWVFTSG